jgi:hypothetical protein
LVVDPVIGNARFSKVLMDGGSSLNILNAHTLRLLGIRGNQLRPSTTPFHSVAPSKRVQPLGQIDLPVWFGTPDNFCKETITFEVVGFRGSYHAILKDRYGEPERGGSDWEPIKILLEGDGNSNKTNMASNTRLRLTTQVGQAHAVTGVLLDLGTNKQPSEPKHTNTHNGNLHNLLPVLHRSDRWPVPVRPMTLVRPVDRAGPASCYSSRTTSALESLSDFSSPGTKTPSKHNLHGRKTLHKA